MLVSILQSLQGMLTEGKCCFWTHSALLTVIPFSLAILRNDLNKVLNFTTIAWVTRCPIKVACFLSTRKPDPDSFLSKISQANPEKLVSFGISLIEEQADRVLLVLVQDLSQESSFILAVLRNKKNNKSFICLKEIWLEHVFPKHFNRQLLV